MAAKDTVQQKLKLPNVAGTCYFHQFDSIQALERYLETTPPTQEIESRRADNQILDPSRHEDMDWYGGIEWRQNDNSREARQRMVKNLSDLNRTGYTAGMRRVEALAKKANLDLRPRYDNVKRGAYNPSRGGVANVPLVLSGHPMPQQRFMPTKRISPTLNMHVILSPHSGITSRQVDNVGCGVAAAIAHIESTGVRMNVFIQFATRFGRDNQHLHVASIRLKKSDQDTNLAALCMALQHPASLRVHYFKLQDRIAKPAIKGLSSSRGRCYSDVPEGLYTKHQRLVCVVPDINGGNALETYQSTVKQIETVLESTK